LTLAHYAAGSAVLNYAALDAGGRWAVHAEELPGPLRLVLTTEAFESDDPFAVIRPATRDRLG
jgi:hypothetical protein